MRVMRFGQHNFVQSIRLQCGRCTRIARHGALRSETTTPIGRGADNIVARQRVTVDEQQHFAALPRNHFEELIVAHNVFVGQMADRCDGIRWTI